LKLRSRNLSSRGITTIAIKPTAGTSLTSRQVEVTAQMDIIA